MRGRHSMLLKNLKYRNKVLLILAPVLLAVFAGLLVVYTISCRDLTKEHTERLERASRRAQDLMGVDVSVLLENLNAFRTDEGIISFFQGKTASLELRKNLGPAFKRLSMDSLELFNKEGRPLFILSKKGLPVPSRIMNKNVVSGFGKTPRGIEIIAAGPVIRNGGIIGFVETSRVMDNSFLAELAETTGAEHSIITDSAVAASTLANTGLPYRPKGGKLNISGKVYSVDEMPLKDMSGKVIGRFVTAISDAPLEGSLKRIRLYTSLVGAWAVLVLAGLAVLLISTLVNPLKEMVQVVDRIARGEFRPLVVRGKDEIAVLSGRFNMMQSQLKTSRGEIERYTQNLEKIIEERSEELKRVERQLMRSRKMESLGVLAGGIAHDFGNLLSAILGYASIAKDELGPEDPQYKYWDIVEQAATRGADLVAQLLTFSLGTAEAGRMQNVNINRLAGEFVKLITATFPKSISIQTGFYGKPLHIRGESTSIFQAMLNIAINARDAMPEGGRLLMETRPFRADEDFVRSHPEGLPGDYVLISISDTGAGIKKEDMERIFEPFYTTKQAGKGTGLGLAIVYGIVKKHGGFIEVDSQEGKGATFTLYLPASAEPENTAPQALSKTQKN